MRGPSRTRTSCSWCATSWKRGRPRAGAPSSYGSRDTTQTRAILLPISWRLRARGCDTHSSCARWIAFFFSLAFRDSNVFSLKEQIPQLWYRLHSTRSAIVFFMFWLAVCLSPQLRLSARSYFLCSSQRCRPSCIASASPWHSGTLPPGALCFHIWPLSETRDHQQNSRQHLYLRKYEDWYKPARTEQMYRVAKIFIYVLRDIFSTTTIAPVDTGYARRLSGDSASIKTPFCATLPV